MIPISKPFLDSEEIRSVQDVISSGWIIHGSKVAEFEQMFSSYVNSQYACAVSSGTAALHLALLAVGVKPGNIVITVSHSFIATSNSIRMSFAEPVFVDVESSSLNMSFSKLKNLINSDFSCLNSNLYYKNIDKLAVDQSPLVWIDRNNPEYGKIGAILIPHQFGLPADILNIVEIASKYNIPVVEDAACAIGSSILNPITSVYERIGLPHGDIACFSFHPRKVLTTGEGGIITTNNEEYYNKIKSLRQHGMSFSAYEKHNNDIVDKNPFNCNGFNYRITDIQAAIGIEQLKKLDNILDEREYLADIYNYSLKSIDWIDIPYVSTDIKMNWQSYVIKIKPESGKNRDDIIDYLKENGVIALPGIINAHECRHYSNLSGLFDLSESEAATRNCLLLPLYNGLHQSDLLKVIELLKNY